MIQSNAERTEDLDALLGEVIDEFLAQAALGERPDVDEYARRYPQLADWLRHGMPALELLANSVASAGLGRYVEWHAE